MKGAKSSRTLQHMGPLLCLVVMLGCAKDIDTFIPDRFQKGDVIRFFTAARENLSQTTTINIDHPTAVVTPRKTVLIFQPNSFIDPTGKIVTGLVEIHILELLTKGEILLYGIPTNNRANLLRSGGEFYITASQDGTSLTMRPGMSVRVLTDVSGVPDNRMELFYDVLDNDFVQPVYTWDEADGNANTWDNVDVIAWVALADSQQIVNGYGYESFSDSLNWINFGAFAQVSAQNTANICVTLPEAFGNINSRVFLVFKDIHSVLALSVNSQSGQFCNNYGQFVKQRIPVGASVTFVVVSEQGEDTYYFAQKEAVIEKSHMEFIEPVRVPLEEIKDAILKL